MRKFRYSVLMIVFYLFSCEPAAADQIWSGALTLNYRAIGRQPKEVQIEDQLMLSDFFLRLDDNTLEDFPFMMEFAFDGEGKPELYQITIKSLTVEKMQLAFGRFVIPFGRYNELYRPDKYFTLSKPLLYGTPSMDYAVGINFPRPMFAAGYTDTGIRIDGDISALSRYLPDSFSFYIVNGLQESGREPLESDLFIIPAHVEGIDVDWSHERNFLSDNNDTKTFGARVHYDIGDMSFMTPQYLGGTREIEGLSCGISGMTGKYDIEDKLDYYVIGADAAFQYGEMSISAEFGYSPTEFRAYNVNYASAASGVPMILKDRYTNYGYYVQAIAPFPEIIWSKRTNLICRFAQAFRAGPDLSVRFLDPETGVQAITPGKGRLKTRLDKYTVALNNLLKKNFLLKAEFSYWDFDIYEDFYQIIVGGVLSF